MRYIIAGLLLFLFVVGVYPIQRFSESHFSYSEIQKIDPVLVIDYNTLIDPSRTQESLQGMFKIMAERQFVLSHPLFGNVYNPDLLGTRINVIIQSGGGLVSEGKIVSDLLISIKTAGYPIDCYVSEAQSMAFFIMVTGCSRVIAKHNVKLMQHREAYGGKNYTPDTYVMDIYMARKEAESLGFDPNKWLAFTRTGTDKVFTLPEIMKYKLVDEFMKP